MEHENGACEMQTGYAAEQLLRAGYLGAVQALNVSNDVPLIEKKRSRKLFLSGR